MKNFDEASYHDDFLCLSLSLVCGLESINGKLSVLNSLITKYIDHHVSLRRVGKLSVITISFLGNYSHLYLQPSCKDLGVILDSHLSFNDHIDYLSPSLLSKLRQINRVLHLFTKDVLSVILDSLAFCKLLYCSTVWLGTTQANIRKLHLLQNTQSMTISHHPSMKLVGFPQMKCYSSDVTMVCKCLHGLAPNYLETKLVKRFSTHCYTTQKTDRPTDR